MAKQRRTSLFGAALLAFVLSAAMPKGVLAESVSSAGTAIAPPLIDITANGGETIQRTLQVSNLGNSAQGYSFVVASLSAAGEEGEAAYSVDDGDLASWISVSPENVTLEANASIDVTVTIEVPSNASAGGHYATIFAKTENSASSSSTGSTVNQMVGANVLLKVTGNVVEQAMVESFKLSDASLDVGETIDFEVRVSNLGNTHIAPEGYIELFRDGKSVAQLAVNDAGANVLPNSTRKFTVSSDELYLPGSYTASVSLAYGSGKTLSAENLGFAVRGEYSFLILLTVVLAIMVGALLPALFLHRKKVRV